MVQAPRDAARYVGQQADTYGEHSDAEQEQLCEPALKAYAKNGRYQRDYAVGYQRFG